jgi:hypothetical protein
MDDSASCIGLLPQDLRASLPTFSPAHPKTTNSYHYLLPYTTSSGDSTTDQGGYSVVTVPTGVMGDLSYLTLFNLAGTWLAFLLLAKKGVNLAMKMRNKQAEERVVVETEEKEKKAT